ncbi:ABC transporter substrate-binding protein [Gryllotalpicola daejeonensis]|uniref:ABC transporter substrate-binding protein n=1 Tax=Gryllotalpicola daejeonensis TaxID=993087 RepID=A0ABP7ZNW6_9MICO
MHQFRRVAAVAVVGTAAALVLAACGSGGSSNNSSSGAGKNLVVDTTYDLVTLDPGRDFEFTGNLIDAQLYETALTYKGDDLSKPVPEITTYSISDDDKVVTLKLNGKHTFSDGKAVTADDIVFSYQRLLGLAGNPSFLLQDPAGKNIEIAKTDDNTVTLTSSVANPALPFILPNPSLGIVEKSVVTANGGTTDEKDSAQSYLDAHSAGSGPYEISSSDIKSRVVLTANPHYAGDKPVYTKVVVQNATGATQKVNLQSGAAQFATDVSPQDAKSLESAGKIKTTSGASLYTLYAWFNQMPQFGGPVANEDFLNAVRHGIDYDKILKLVGPGSVQPGGVVPQGVFGSLKSDPSNSYDPATAKSDLEKSGYKGQAIKLLVDSEATAGNASFLTIAQTIQAQLKEIGINLQLEPQPGATALATFRSHTFQAGFAEWGADFPDASDYVAFGPDQNVGLRAGWATGKGIDSAETLKPLFDKALTTTDNSAREKAWQDVQTEMNKVGPFIPILQPGALESYSPSVKGVVYNPLWNVKFSDLK